MLSPYTQSTSYFLLFSLPFRHLKKKIPSESILISFSGETSSDGVKKRRRIEGKEKGDGAGGRGGGRGTVYSGTHISPMPPERLVGGWGKAQGKLSPFLARRVYFLPGEARVANSAQNY